MDLWNLPKGEVIVTIKLARRNIAVGHSPVYYRERTLCEQVRLATLLHIFDNYIMLSSYC